MGVAISRKRIATTSIVDAMENWSYPSYMSSVMQHLGELGWGWVSLFLFLNLVALGATVWSLRRQDR